MTNRSKLSFAAARGRWSGFTLIELLIVIAIITLLAAILFPVFSRVRENARRTSCQSNEKQLALGLMQYAQDFDERFPNCNATLPGDQPFWFEVIQPYVNSYAIVRCTSFPFKSFTDGDPSQTTYAMPGQNNYLYPAKGRALGTIPEPARTWVIFESKNSNPSPTYKAYGYPYVNLNSYTGPKGGVFGDTRHFEGMNVAFVDGHVKWIKSGDGTNWIWKLL